MTEEDAIDCDRLKLLKNFIELYLNLTKIRILPHKCLSPLVKLKIIELKDIFLYDWEVDIRRMLNITVIRLQRNSIDGFPMERQDHLSEVFLMP